jgi:hypothetical protein
MILPIFPMEELTSSDHVKPKYDPMGSTELGFSEDNMQYSDRYKLHELKSWPLELILYFHNMVTPNN